MKNKKKDDKALQRITVDEDREEGNVKAIIYHKYIIYMGGYGMLILVLFVFSLPPGFHVHHSIEADHMV